MTKYIQSIVAQIPNFIDKEVNIDFSNGKHLILVGKNGCGKTSFINSIYSKINERLRNNLPQLIMNNKNSLGHAEKRLNTLASRTQGHSERMEMSNLRAEIIRLNEVLSNFESKPFFGFDDEDKILRWCIDDVFIIQMFKANRVAEIKKPKGISGIDLSSFGLDNVGANLEQYLVNLDTRSLHEETRLGNPQRANEIKEWIINFEKSMKYLTEDNSTYLHFDVDTYTVEIRQENKAPYSFQHLSSGFSSIFHVLAPLIMQSEYYKVLPSDLKGVVFIDEVDAHLHVSLQKKILTFLTNLFPSIQFIVTTHSPFIVTSLEDAVVYDLSSLEQLADLTAYSYESIIEGLFRVTTASESLEYKIKEIIKLIDTNQVGTEEFRNKVDHLRNDQDKMDPESLYFWKRADLLFKKASNV